ncbi:MAG: hypothetical protein IJS44_01960 [Clostridia bacterium]|nr:hypothetical protein [Clostridia bacterium]
MRKREFLLVIFTGGIVYCFIEILWRGYTHWSMALLGALCFGSFYYLEPKLSRVNFFLRMLILCALVTAYEFCFGVVFNLWLGYNVWDYTNLKINFMGQISLLYSFFWYWLCILSHFLRKLIRQRIFDALPSTANILPNLGKAKS